ncbi:UDP-glucuronosyl/UDP-glucosyltransferase [Trema orientale]|uniref:UDP-glucuronosyl/UDP-glucosyltransferase n=1 Tax=Trema orientale TaxID=63057 RepID=A0A2P5G0G0_TREOI|nr:UDP-glucuronosyl/UDP-glucosyltransferase [Trema orientale]
MMKLSTSIRCMHVANVTSRGVIVNTFPELDGEKSPKISADKVIGWLDMCKEDNSVVSVGFGSQINLTGTQMEALVNALDESEVWFVWAIKKPMKGVLQMGETDDTSMVPTWFEDRTARTGLVFRGWVPQVAIFRHRTVGSYFTHCGWNSMLEGIFSGVLLLAWPIQADHFNNARLMVDKLGLAVQVCEGLSTVPKLTELAKVLVESVGQTSPEMAHAMELGKVALKSTSPGRSSHIALDALVKDLSSTY